VYLVFQGLSKKLKLAPTRLVSKEKKQHSMHPFTEIYKGREGRRSPKYKHFLANKA